MKTLASKFELTWSHVRPFSKSLGGAPVAGPLRGAREPAEFGLWVGRR